MDHGKHFIVVPHQLKRGYATASPISHFTVGSYIDIYN